MFTIFLVDSSITNVAWLLKVGLIFKAIKRPNRPKSTGDKKSILYILRKLSNSELCLIAH
jgi:hypothetical protein